MQEEPWFPPEVEEWLRRSHGRGSRPDTEVVRRVRRRAEALGIPFAEFLQRIQAGEFEFPMQDADPSSVFDLGSSEGSNVARDKDAMIAEAVLAQWRRSTNRE